MISLDSCGEVSGRRRAGPDSLIFRVGSPLQAPGAPTPGATALACCQPTVSTRLPAAVMRSRFTTSGLRVSLRAAT